MTTSRRDSWLGVLYSLAAITAWGVYFPLAKIVLRTLSPVVFLTLRLGIGAAILLALCLMGRVRLSLARRDLGIVLGAGAVGIIAHQLIQVNSLRFTSATNTGWILTLIPPVTGLLGWVFLRERVSWRQVIGLLIAVIGVLFLATRGNPARLSFVHNWGDILALCSVLTWSLYTIMTKSRLIRYSPLAIATIHMTMGFVFFLGLGAGRLGREAGAMSAQAWWLTILIGIVPSGLAYYWWAAGLKRLSAMNTSMFLFLEAIVATLAGYALLGEELTIAVAGYAAIIIAGVYYAQTRPVTRQ
ncbi:MAG: DMT family transporter [Candidatus Zixiibacteriota bacterium]